MLLACASTRRRPVGAMELIIADTALLGIQAAEDDSTGILINGLATNDILIIEKSLGLTYPAWSAWPSDNDPSPGAGGKTWLNRFMLSLGGHGGTPVSVWDTNKYATATESESVAVAQSPQTFSGSTAYVIWLSDNASADNRGGLSVRVWRKRA